MFDLFRFELSVYTSKGIKLFFSTLEFRAKIYPLFEKSGHYLKV